MTAGRYSFNARTRSGRGSSRENVRLRPDSLGNRDRTRDSMTELVKCPPVVMIVAVRPRFPRKEAIPADAISIGSRRASIKAM